MTASRWGESASSARARAWSKVTHPLLDLLPDPKVGALTQILTEYAPSATPQIIRSVAADIDAIFLQVHDANWRESQPGDRAVRREIRLVLKKHGLRESGDLFDRAYAYVCENY